jgi:hypothetical protein
MKLPLVDAARAEMLKGAVGTGAAVEFNAFTRVFHDLPRLADVLSGAADLSKIQRPDVMRAVVYSVLAWAGENANKDRYDPAAAVATRIPDEWGVLLVRRLYDLSPNLMMGASSWRQLCDRYGKYLGQSR